MKEFVFDRIWMDGRFSWSEEAIGIQDGLKSDIAMCLDECPPADATRDQMEMAVSRTSFWAGQCQEEWTRKKAVEDGRNLFGIVQGGRFEDLRTRSAEKLSS